MAELQTKTDEPHGDSSCHRPLAELEARLRELPGAPKDLGRLALIVCRSGEGLRETPERVHLTAEDGVPGDSWGRRTPRKLEAQLAVMRRDVAELIANGQPLTVFGDNLFVDLDISVANLPVGSRLRVGGAIVEVTPLAHNGCAKFKERFGSDALHFVNAQPTREQNLRGIYWKVVESGEAAVGAPIQVLARGEARSEA
ncbi:MAG TPA: MOSC domain-containing protein [Verrucomicrobiae bacterium]|nr:MOSC domain-containing protein [Verrucomicrobiae bacterium]